MQNLQEELITLLEGEEIFVVDGQLNKTKIIEAVLKVDPVLIRHLLANPTFRKHFFQEVEGVLVFDKIAFQRFVNNKSFLPDSYTAFKNKIGLAISDGTTDNYITSRNDVSLVWPHKDCILEGGQTKEDQKRNEIFWNETLAPDSIDRLLSPKAFSNFRRYDESGEHELKEISANENLLIKGNNLLTISSLLPVFRGRVKLIYIDPPYNTGSDGFDYNDSFNHSTWLTFLKNRLELARQMLTPDGTIAISIDHNELGYLLVLMDEVFDVQNRKNIITIKRGSTTGAKVINPGVVNISEYVVLYSRNSGEWSPNRVFMSKDWDRRYSSYIKHFDKGPDSWEFSTVLEEFAIQTGIKKSQLKKYYGEEYEEKLEVFVYANADRIMQPATLDENSVSAAAVELKMKSQEFPDRVFILEREGKRPYFIRNGKLILFAKDRMTKIDGKETFSQPATDIWDDVLPNDLHNEGGVRLRKGKKPEKLIARLVELCTKEGDLVLDFFSGSGTTGTVCLKLARQFIICEQLEYTETLPLQRLVNTVNGEQSGVSKSYEWKGGGSFVYMELMKYNQLYLEKTQEATTKDGLLDIWQEMDESAYLSYRFDKKTFNERLDAFRTAPIDQMKQYLVEILDKNQLYVNYSEIEDETFQVSDTDKQLNHQFYQKK